MKILDPKRLPVKAILAVILISFQLFFVCWCLDSGGQRFTVFQKVWFWATIVAAILFILVLVVYTIVWWKPKDNAGKICTARDKYYRIINPSGVLFRLVFSFFVLLSILDCFMYFFFVGVLPAGHPSTLATTMTSVFLDATVAGWILLLLAFISAKLMGKVTK